MVSHSVDKSCAVRAALSHLELAFESVHRQANYLLPQDCSSLLRVATHLRALAQDREHAFFSLDLDIDSGVPVRIQESDHAFAHVIAESGVKSQVFSQSGTNSRITALSLSVPKKEASESSLQSIDRIIGRHGPILGHRTHTGTVDVTPLANKISTADVHKHDIIFEVGTDTHANAMLNLVTSMQETSNKGKFMASRARRFCSLYASYPLFMIDAVMAIVIIANAIVIGISCDDRLWAGWLWINIVFCCLFFIELLMKMWIMGWRQYFLGAGWKWQMFELGLLVMSVGEVIMDVQAASAVQENVQGASLLRIFRLVRLTKLLRICRLPFASDLVLMINGAIGGLRTLCWSMVMLALPLYVVALILRETLGQEDIIDGVSGGSADQFSNLSKSFFTVFRCVVAGDCSDPAGRPIFLMASAEYGWGYGMLYATTVTVMTFGLFNVIVAIYVERTVAAAKCNDTRLKEQRLRDQQMFHEKALQLAMFAYSFKSGLDLDAILTGELDMQGISGMELSQEEFSEILNCPGFSDLLSELDIAVGDQKDLFDTLDVDRSGTLDVHELISGITRLRGDARKSDIVAVLLSVRHLGHLIADVLTAVEMQGARMLPSSRQASKTQGY